MNGKSLKVSELMTQHLNHIPDKQSGAKTFCIISLSITTLSVTILSITILIIMTFSMKTLSVMTQSSITPSKVTLILIPLCMQNNTSQNNILLKDTEHNKIKMTFIIESFVIMGIQHSIIILLKCYGAECRSTCCYYAGCRSAQQCGAFTICSIPKLPKFFEF
jgi:hypothetical protein